MFSIFEVIVYRELHLLFEHAGPAHARADGGGQEEAGAALPACLPAAGGQQTPLQALPRAHLRQEVSPVMAQ